MRAIGQLATPARKFLSLAPMFCVCLWPHSCTNRGISVSLPPLRSARSAGVATREQAIKAAAGYVRIEVESALSRGGRGRGGAAGGFHVAGGNYFSAQPIGVRNGLDYGCTGEVRKVEADRIR